MKPEDIRDKFGNDFIVTDHTFKLGIDHRFTEHLKLYLGESHELYCLYFGELINTVGETGFYATI